MSDRPTLTLFCGLPGSGKTTLAKQLAQAGAGIRLCTDEWQDDLGGMNPEIEHFHNRLQAKLYTHALELLSHGMPIVLEDGLWTQAERTAKLQDAKQHGAVTELHFFDVSTGELWKRIEQRNQQASYGVVHIDPVAFKRCCDRFQKPTLDELAQFDTVFIYTDDSPHPNSAR